MSGKWSTSVNIEKVKRGGVSGLINHHARDVDEKNLRHGNAQIDPSRTSQNESFIFDENGKLIESKSTQEWTERFESRLSAARSFRTNKRTGKKTPVEFRKDAVMMGAVVLQLDPDFTGEVVNMTTEKREEVRSLMLGSMLQTLVKKVGHENIVGASIHWDETHPHLHVLFTPVDDENRLRWKSFIDGKQDLSKLHDEFRNDLRAAGYDATFERIDGGKKGVDITQFKREKERQSKLKRRETEIEKLAGNVARRSKEVARGNEELQRRVSSVNEQIQDRVSELGDREKKVAAAEAELRERQLSAERVLRRVRELRNETDSYHKQMAQTVQQMRSDATLHAKNEKRRQAAEAQRQKLKQSFLDAGLAWDENSSTSGDFGLDF